MIIDLKTIEEEGKEYRFTEKSEELEGFFTDLVEDHSFQVSVDIRPLGNSFQIHGEVQSGYKDICSKCGYEVEVPLYNKINEILTIEEKRPRHSQSVHGQNSVQFDESGPSVTYINDFEFNLGEFLHEIIAAGMEQYPKCSNEKKCKEQQYEVKPDDSIQKTQGHPGFASLKNIKLKH